MPYKSSEYTDVATYPQPAEYTDLWLANSPSTQWWPPFNSPPAEYTDLWLANHPSTQMLQHTPCLPHGLMAGQLTEYTVVATNSLPAEYTDLWSVHQPYMQWLPHTLCLPNNEHGPVACTYQYPLMMDKPRTPTCCRCNMGANIYM